MASTKDAARRGLPWPDHYADLQGAIAEQWGVDGTLYLVRKLSGGKSGAFVFVADLNSRDFAGQAILKLDDYPDAESREKNEAERHAQALETAPDFGAAHLPKIVNTYVHKRKLAIMSTIAGRGLEYAEPWATCPYDVQLATAATLSRECLEDWNAGYRLSDGLMTPQDLLRGWLGYRIDPDKGRVHAFAKSAHGLTADQPTFIFDGTWFPNPLAFIDPGKAPGGDLQLRAVTGNIHGDLHGLNVLVSRQPKGEPAYYLIDLALYQADQFLFYDHAYFELTHLLRSRDQANAENWLSILDSVGRLGQGGAVAQGDDLGLVQLVATVRRELFGWVDRHEGNRLSHMESQALLARVAVGLCFVHRQISAESRSMALLYAAKSLKDLLQLTGVDWPKYGPPMVIVPDAADAPTAGRASPARRPEAKPAAEAEASPAGRQSIAVVGFENRSDDPEQTYFAEGMTEDLVTDLSRVDWLTVIAQQAADAYADGPIDPRRIGTELGVRYIVTGSVRKAGETLRVTAHLIDARNAVELWGERYDRKVADLFAVQDEIAAAIVTNIDSEAKLTQREGAAHKRGPLDFWETYQKATWHYFKLTPEDDAEATRELKKAARVAPGFAAARALLALLGVRRFVQGLAREPAQELKHAAENARQAVDIDDNSALAHLALAAASALQGDREAGIGEAEVASRRNPSAANPHVMLGGARYWNGQPAEALAALEQAVRFNPRDRFRVLLDCIQALCKAELDQPGEAEAAARAAARAAPRAPLVHIVLASVLVRAGHLDEARAAIADVRRLRPGYGIDTIGTTFAGMVPAQRDRFLDGLRQAGLTE